MISINLLPEAYRKAKGATLQEFHRSPLVILIVVVLVGLGLCLGGLVQVRNARLTQLTSRIQQLQAKKTAIDRLKTEVQHLRDQQQAFERLSHERSRWAQYLNRLSDVTPEGVWYLDLSLDTLQKGLTLRGLAISQSGEEMVRIGRLVQELKADRTFSEAVKNIQIESIKSAQDQDKEGHIELVEFTIAGQLATPPAGATP